ncbi:MAG: sugar-phosphatase [Clostridiales bacterium]|jgi:Cof subfamily protein (haloacid dehalogenase superfamily)|nr:sugar-phosphatase [Clostridiales bacterium]
MYKLLAIDMDGTLLNEKKEISNRCKADIRKLQEKGISVVLATGRPFDGVLPYINELELFNENDFVVVYNGALVQSTNGKKVLIDRPLSITSYKELYKVSNELDVNIHALTETSVLTPRNNPYTHVESSINKIPVIEGNIEDIDESTNIVKVMFIDDPKKLDKIIPLIPQWVKEKYNILRSAPIFLEFLDKGVDKGVGVSLIAKELGIEAKEVICIGDAENDIAMIKYAGLGVAMANATDDAKSVADYITLSNEEDGVAHVIEKFIL